jgi:glycolate oxidase iron-sulfur subunit
MSKFEDLTTQCIRCGFCLEDCPTFVQTGNELESPRGRIYLIRSAIEGKLDWVDDVAPHTDLCLGCRACETACPSGVEYGAILELAKQEISNRKPNALRKAFLTGTTNPVILKTQLAMSKLLPGERVPMFVSKALSGKSAEANLPTPQTTPNFPPIERAEQRGEVYFLEGCAMKVLYPRVHAASRRLLQRIGYTVKESKQGCCGALHAHNGELRTAKKMAQSTFESFPEDLPIIVNSAGCGSTMKEYTHLTGDQKFDAFSNRIFDLTEFLLNNGLIKLLKTTNGLKGTRVTYHDACHLSHGQKITSAPRELIRSISGIDFVELPESMMCCGSAGIYNILQPEMARKLLDRKVEHIQSTKATIVATGNPGCHGWIHQGCREQNSAQVLHTAELLEAAFIGLETFVQ